MEIKAGATYVPDMTRALRRSRSLHEGLAGAALVDGIRLVPYAQTARLLFGE